MICFSVSQIAIVARPIANNIHPMSFSGFTKKLIAAKIKIIVQYFMENPPMGKTQSKKELGY